MNIIEINLDDYLDESTKEEIARDVFRRRLESTLETANDVERFVGNVAYTVVWEEIDKRVKLYGDDLREKVAAKTVELIGKLSERTVVDRGIYGLRPSPTLAAQIIDETVKGSRGLIEERVRALLKEISLDDIQYAIHEQITDAFRGVSR